MIYADHAATAPLSTAARIAMEPYLAEGFGNPSSAHSAGRQARRALDAARGSMARSLGCSPREVFFTSGGTEADNQALASVFEAGRDGGHVVTTAFEHPAVLRAVERMVARGWEASFVEPSSFGTIDAAAVEAAVRPDTVAVSVMAVNNEVGTIQPIGDVGRFCRSREVLFHTDAVQAVGHIPIGFDATGADYLALSAHKFGGPKGVGALLVRQGSPLSSLICGGGQERGMRAGTENVAGIVGMAAALDAALASMDERSARLENLRARLIEGVSRSIPEAHQTVGGVRCSPGIVHFCFEGFESETLVILLDEAGICVSAGSACAAGSWEPSATLRAMRVPVAWAQGALRISLGDEASREDVDAIVAAIAAMAARLRGDAA